MLYNIQDIVFLYFSLHLFMSFFFYDNNIVFNVNINLN